MFESCRFQHAWTGVVLVLSTLRHVMKPNRQCTYNATLWRVRVTTVARETQQCTHSLCYERRMKSDVPPFQLILRRKIAIKINSSYSMTFKCLYLVCLITSVRTSATDKLVSESHHGRTAYIVSATKFRQSCF